MTDCPHSETIGSHGARIAALECNFEKLEKVAMANANFVLTGQVDNKWMRRIALGIGYLIIAGVFMVAGQITGAAEWILKLVKVF